MANRIGVAVHHQEDVLSSCDDEVGSVVARLRGLGEEVQIAILELKILDTPGTPEGFDLGFGKLHWVVRQKRSGTVPAEKKMSSAVFRPRIARYARWCLEAPPSGRRGGARALYIPALTERS